MHDNKGRQFIAFHEVRNALLTASATLTTGTATSLIVGDASNHLDIIEISLANNSTASASITLSNDGSTIRTIQVPAGDTLHMQFNNPLRQTTKNTPWIIDMEDITGTSIGVEATLIKV